MITEEQRRARRHTIGSSDAPAIVGADPNKTRLAVYLEKVFEVEDLANKGAIARGNRYESVLVDWVAEELGVEIERNVSLVHPDGICSANLDGRVVGKKQGVEAKYTGLAEEWGEERTDAVPERVIVQTHHQMYVDGLELVWVPVLLARHGRPVENLYVVERNEDLISGVVDLVHAFHRDHIVTKLPPPLDGPPPLDVLKRIKRKPEKVAAIPSEIVTAWDAARKVRLLAEKEEKTALTLLLAALGDAEGGDFGDPSHWFTYLETPRAGYTVGPCKYRTPRITKR